MSDPISTVGGRVVSLTESARDRGELRVPSLPDWSVRDLIAHFADLLQRYATDVRSSASFSDGPQALPEWNASVIAASDSKSLDELIAAIPEGLGSLTEALAEADPDETRDFHAGMKVPIEAIESIVLGELLVHGWDLSRALGERWPIYTAEVDTVFRGVTPVIPIWMNPERCAGHTATYRISVRGGDSYLWQFENGEFVTEPVGSPHIDCHISGAAGALMLTFYQRRSPLWGAATGRVFAWGFKPWLAFTLASRFYQP